MRFKSTYKAYYKHIISALKYGNKYQAKRIKNNYLALIKRFKSDYKALIKRL